MRKQNTGNVFHVGQHVKAVDDLHKDTYIASLTEGIIEHISGSDAVIKVVSCKSPSKIVVGKYYWVWNTLLEPLD